MAISCCNDVWFCLGLQTRNHYESTREQMEELMKRMKDPSSISKMQMPMEGYLYCQEKCEYSFVWTRFSS